MEVVEFGGERAEWDEFVRNAPSAHFSHQYEWLQLVKDAYGGEPYYLAAYEEDNLVGVLPMMLRHVIGDGHVLFSTPYADEGGAVTNDAHVERELIDAGRSIADAKRVAHLELRQRHEPSHDMQVDLSRVDLELELPSEQDDLWDGFKGKVRNQVRKAKKAGLEATRQTDLHAAIADGFYPVYSENMRDLGSPMHAEDFFHQVADRFSNSARVVVVRIEETVVGSAFALVWQDTFFVPWASSLRRYFDMCPNNILYWQLMRWAIDEGHRMFDFGRSPRDSGTYRFKEQWGAKPVQLYYCYDGITREPDIGEQRDAPAYRAFSVVWRRMPLPLARLLGPKIFARLPI